MSFKTPGVYIEEQSTFPLSVAGLSTAILVFIGKTKRLLNDVQYQPIKACSLLEYKNVFRTAPAERLIVSADPLSNIPIRVTLSNEDNKLRLIMYYKLQLFFNNGGGECYVVSLGKEIGVEAGKEGYIKAIDNLSAKPDITILVLSNADYYLPHPFEVYKAAWSHCESRQNCFVILDTKYECINNAEGLRRCFNYQDIPQGY